MTDDITKAGERAVRLTEQLLAYAGKSFSAAKELDVSSVVHDAIALLEPSISNRATLQHSLRPDLIAEADPGQARQIVMNLVTNAIEAMGQNQKGDIFIETGVQEIAGSRTVMDEVSEAPVPPGRYCFVEVRDTGLGIPRQIHDRIFDPFFTTKFPGRGLGLSVVAGMLRNQHGFIQVMSTPGRGSTFRILLPCVNCGTDTANTYSLANACNCASQ
jgi:two-component system, cell cycle sensor histidine kinase and response regulator CckA